MNASTVTPTKPATSNSTSKQEQVKPPQVQGNKPQLVKPVPPTMGADAKTVKREASPANTPNANATNGGDTAKVTSETSSNESKESTMASPKEKTYNASEAAKAGERAYTSVVAAKEKLAGLGAKVEGTGKEWVIPHSALVTLGWVDEQGNPIASKRGRSAGTSNKPRTVKPADGEELSIPELHKLYEEATAEAERQAQVAADAKSDARNVKKRLDAAIAGAEAAFAKAQADLEAAKQYATS